MTDKQRKILEKYLNEKNLKKLDDKDFECTSTFINMIIQNRWFHTVCGEMCSIPNFEMNTSKENEDYIKEIEQIVNKRRKDFGLLEDEYACVDKVFYFDDDHKWYSLKQIWFKGMSESPSTRTVMVKYYHSPVEYCSTCSSFEGIYNELFDMGIYSMVGLVKFFYGKANGLSENY